MKTIPKNDRLALRFAGFLGHTYFILADDKNGKPFVKLHASRQSDLAKHSEEGDRWYRKLAPGKFKKLK